MLVGALRPRLVAVLVLAACHSHHAPKPDAADDTKLVPLVLTHPTSRDRTELHTGEAPPPEPDPRHAELDGGNVGYGGAVRVKSSLGGGNEAHDGAVRVKLEADGIYRWAKADKTWTQIARSFPTSYKKRLVIDADRAYWIEPAAAAVLSVPIAGGPVSLVCQAPTPVEEDLALHGDTLYLIDIGCGLHAVDKHGGPRRFLGVVHDGFGTGRNGIQMTADDDGLHVVTVSVSMSGGELSEGRMSLLVSYPERVGEPEHDEDGGLLFPASYADRRAFGRHPFAEIEDELKAGRIVVTVSVTTDGARPDIDRGEAGEAQAWLRDAFGPGARSEVVVVAPPADAGPYRRWPWTDVGISRTQVPALFAPKP